MALTKYLKKQRSKKFTSRKLVLESERKQAFPLRAFLTFYLNFSAYNMQLIL